MEGRETIETELLNEVAKILDVPSDAIHSLPDTDLAAVVFSPKFHDNSGAGWFSNFTTINLNGKVIELFERLLTSEQQKVEMLTRQVDSLTKKLRP